jgi:hypothetical protein
MEIVENQVEMRGMKRAEIVNYFISIGGNALDSEKLLGQGWEVEISKEKTITLGSLKFPATVVILRCRKDLMEQMIAHFRLRFLSAGG